MLILHYIVRQNQIVEMFNILFIFVGMCNFLLMLYNHLLLIFNILLVVYNHLFVHRVIYLYF